MDASGDSHEEYRSYPDEYNIHSDTEDIRNDPSLVFDGNSGSNVKERTVSYDNDEDLDSEEYEIEYQDEHGNVISEEQYKAMEYMTDEEYVEEIHEDNESDDTGTMYKDDIYGDYTDDEDNYDDEEGDYIEDDSEPDIGQYDENRESWREEEELDDDDEEGFFENGEDLRPTSEELQTLKDVLNTDENGKDAQGNPNTDEGEEARQKRLEELQELEKAYMNAVRSRLRRREKVRAQEEEIKMLLDVEEEDKYFNNSVNFGYSELILILTIWLFVLFFFVRYSGFGNDIKGVAYPLMFLSSIPLMGLALIYVLENW